MPNRPPSICPACGDATVGRCPCRPARRPWATQPRAWSGGGTRRWRRFRNAWLADHPWCAGYGGPCTRTADAVDHVINLGTFPEHEREERRFDRTNVQSLCEDCHRRKTAAEGVAARQAARRERQAAQATPTR